MKSTICLVGILLLFPVLAGATCHCRCVNGQVTQLCDSTIDIKAICAPTICPIVPPSVRPIETPGIPPIGTRTCRQEMVLNEKTREYEWKRVCH